MNLLSPPVTPSDEEPIATGGWQRPSNNRFYKLVTDTNSDLPPPATPSDEEPIATGGWYSFG